MKVLRLFGRICGIISAIVITFVLAVGAMALTNALSPTSFKDKIISTAVEIVELVTGQMVKLGVPEVYAEMIRANIGPEQFIAMLYISVIGLLGALLWLITSSIIRYFFPRRDQSTKQKTDLSQDRVQDEKNQAA